MPTLLLATIPVAMLAEHLVAQVGQLGAAREAADDRARLLGDLSAITADIFPLDVTAVLTQLVAGAEQLGATDVVVRDSAGAVLAQASELPADDADELDEGQERVDLSRDLEVPGGEVHVFSARVTGPEDEVARRVEALDLLVAQARVGLSNAVLVQQLELLKETYQEQATRDQLTGLLNRRGLVITAEQMPGHLGVLFCDLDGFKTVNDTLGHAAGDELLEKVARRLESRMREDTVLGRMGGDEFVVVVPGASDEDLAGLGRRIEIDLGRPFLLEAGMARIGVSVGAAHAAPGERDLDSLLGQADQLMYEVKRNRKVGRPAAPVGEPA
jgi:diguanylate cyclase (GGDEF)-like protein